MRQLFRVFIPGSLVVLLLSEISLIFLCYLAGAWMLGAFLNPYMVFSVYLYVEGGLTQIAFVTVCLVFGLYFQNLYGNIRVKSVTLLWQQVCLDIGLAFLFQALLAYIRRPEWSLPRWAMIFGSVLVLIVIPLWRVLYSRVIVRPSDPSACCFSARPR